MPHWKDFERRVASAYRRLGYNASSDRALGSHQVDVLAEQHIPGTARTTRLAIECKYTEEGIKVGKNEVVLYIAISQDLHSKNLADRVVIVSNVGFTREAIRLAQNSPFIDVVTIAELEEAHFDRPSVYESIQATYESSTIFSSYIRLRGRQTDQHTLVEHGIPDVEAHVLKLLQSPTPQAILITADFGAGKTTLLRRLEYTLAQRITSQVSGRKIRPLFVHLKYYHTEGTVEGSIMRSCAERFGSSVPQDTLFSAIRLGDFALLLDGFDEMQSRADRSSRWQNISSIMHMSGPGSKIVITTRPGYFASQGELRQILGTDSHKAVSADLGTNSHLHDEHIRLGHAYQDIRKSFQSPGEPDLNPAFRMDNIELDLLNASQVDAFLSGWEERFRQSSDGYIGWTDVRSFINDVYDLSDLLERPILLNMICQLAQSGVIDVKRRSIRLGPSSIYESVLRLELDRQFDKGQSRRGPLTTDRRMDFAEVLAVAMYLHGEDTQLNFNEIRDVCQQCAASVWPGEDTNLDRYASEYLSTDAQSSSFLTRTGDLFRFTHKSFVEFFVARHIKSQVILLGSCALLDTRLPKEILYFLGAFAIHMSNRLGHALERIYRDEHKNHETPSARSTNAAAALMYARTLKGLRLPGAQLVGIDICRNDFTACMITNLAVEDTVMRDSNVVGGAFEGRFDKSQISNMSFRSAKISMELVDSSATDVSISDSEKEAVIGGRGCRVSRVHIKSSPARISIEGHAQDINASGSHITIGNGNISSIRCINSVIDIEGGSLDRGLISGCHVVARAPVITKSLRLRSCVVSGICSNSSFELFRSVVRNSVITCSPEAAKGRGIELSSGRYFDTVILGAYIQRDQLVRHEQTTSPGPEEAAVLQEIRSMKGRTGQARGSESVASFFEGLPVFRRCRGVLLSAESKPSGGFQVIKQGKDLSDNSPESEHTLVIVEARRFFEDADLRASIRREVGVIANEWLLHFG